MEGATIEDIMRKVVYRGELRIVSITKNLAENHKDTFERYGLTVSYSPGDGGLLPEDWDVVWDDDSIKNKIKSDYGIN